MLWENIVAAERIAESAEDMTAAETAPSPTAMRESHFALTDVGDPVGCEVAEDEWQNKGAIFGRNY